MIVPQYWAEGRVQHRDGGRQVTIRRFGWSDESQHAAQSHAEKRAQEALQRVLSGEKLPRRDPKVPYNGAEGVPIREEIVARHGGVIITRNAYGARCLNTENVFFIDIDFEEAKPVHKVRPVRIAVVLLVAVAAAVYYHSFLVALIICALGLGVSGAFGFEKPKVTPEEAETKEREAGSRITEFLAAHPDWAFRLYRTPGGLRLVATHQVFDARDPAVEGCFQAVGADPQYARMCRNQHCFRARVSPKPWRIGIERHIRPRPGIWPIVPERMPERIAWVQHYEKVAEPYSACTYLTALGSGVIHPDVAPVVALHDELAKATSGFPSA
jgi:hypothetical protein